MKNIIEIKRDISERQAFDNCVKILDSFELHIKQHAFTINYIKWLLNKFDMPSVFVEPFEDVPPDEIPENTAAFALNYENLISVPIKDLYNGNLYKHLCYITHELTHVADEEFYISCRLLGKNRAYYHEPFTEDTWEKAQIDNIKTDASHLHSIAYYLNPHEMSSRQNEWFYTNMFLRLAQNFTKNPVMKDVLQNNLQACLEQADIVSSHESILHTYTIASMFFEETLKKIQTEAIKAYKQMLKEINNDLDKYLAAREKLMAIVSLFPSKIVAQKLAGGFAKKSSRSLNLVVKSDCLEMLAKMPYETLTEKQINKFLVKRERLTEYLLTSTEPTTLAERFLLLNGTRSIFCEDHNYKLDQIFAQVKKTYAKFDDYYIVGINNMPESRAKQQAIKKFINTTNFKLTPEVLEEYKQI